MRQNRRYSRRPTYGRSCARPCPSGLTYLGNIFLLGMTTLVGELVDLQAGNALEVLLAPFRNADGSDLEQDILAAGVGDTVGNIDILDIGLSEQPPL